MVVRVRGGELLPMPGGFKGMGAATSRNMTNGVHSGVGEMTPVRSLRFMGGDEEDDTSHLMRVGLHATQGMTDSLAIGLWGVPNVRKLGKALSKDRQTHHG